jgi:hypothetical protein
MVVLKLHKPTSFAGLTLDYTIYYPLTIQGIILQIPSVSEFCERLSVALEGKFAFKVLMNTHAMNL